MMKRGEGKSYKKIDPTTFSSNLFSIRKIQFHKWAWTLILCGMMQPHDDPFHIDGVHRVTGDDGLVPLQRGQQVKEAERSRMRRSRPG